MHSYSISEDLDIFTVVILGGGDMIPLSLPPPLKTRVIVHVCDKDVTILTSQ